MKRNPGITMFVLVALVSVAGCSTSMRELPTVDELDTHALEVTSDYEIGELDLLAVSVWQHPKLSSDNVVVRPDGRISVPLVDDVQAAGLTPLELKEVLAERLSEYVTGVQVTVIVRQIRSKIIYVLGEVAREGPLTMRADMRVIDAISTAGGFRPFAGKKRIKIIRNVNGGEPIEFHFDYEAFVDGRNLEQNILLLPNDKIIVPEESPFWR